MATASVYIGAAYQSQRTLLIGTYRAEHCSVNSKLLSQLNLNVKDQIRVTRNDDPSQYAIYTITETYEETEETRKETEKLRIRMGPEGLSRLSSARTLEENWGCWSSVLRFMGEKGNELVTVDTEITRSEKYPKDDAAKDASEFVERLTGNGRDLAVLAPHGGMIEQHTDEQAERVASSIGERATCWTCKGWKRGGGASDRWHITSTEISPKSFPLLRSIIEIAPRFKYAVSFHGFEQKTGEKEKGVLIGGDSRPEVTDLKEKIATEIRGRLQVKGVVDIPVSIPTAADPFSGADPDNIVHRLTDGGYKGIQIEQSGKAREHHSEIADAVASVYKTVFKI